MNIFQIFLDLRITFQRDMNSVSRNMYTARINGVKYNRYDGVEDKKYGFVKKLHFW